MRRVYQVHKLRGIRQQLLKSSPAETAPADPVSEREAWKEHFRKLQGGREQAEESVWANVKPEPLQSWLVNEPTDEEIHTCCKQMRNGKAAGADGFLADYYKYGGEALQWQIKGIVKDMWTHAAIALPG